jgi:hypothetical protein
MANEPLHGGAISESLAAYADATAKYLQDVESGLFEHLTDADLLAELQTVERLRRQQPVLDHRLVSQLEQRGIPGRVGANGVSGLLQSILLLSPYEARSRVAAAHDLSPRLAAEGHPLPPLLAAVAARQQAGEISSEQVRAIAKSLQLIPEGFPATDFVATERVLAEAAETLQPRELGRLGHRLAVALDPEGVMTSDAEHERHRSFTITPEADGSYRVAGRLTPACGAQLTAWLSPRAAPRPAENGAPDKRTGRQRTHDALYELAGLAVRRKELLDSGAPAQVLITMTAEQVTSRAGFAETSFGQLISVGEALKVADEALISLLIQQANGAVLSQGRQSRIASRRQTIALIARDRGCSFPGCDKPPEWTQRHHVVSWAAGGATDVDNLTLLCGQHHRSFEASGWRCQMRDGLPWWIPPKAVDPARRARLNQRIMRR